MDSTVYSARNISLMLDQEDKILLYGQFLDYFYGEKDDEGKYKLIKEEPKYNSSYKLFFCMLAAGVEKLAHDYNLPVPEWTEKPEYFLDKIYYAYNTQNPDFQKYLMQTTLSEYKKRNLIVGDNILKRC